MSQRPDAYDVLPYETGCYREAHPDHLAMIATVFGLNPPPPQTCRVLEVGCASGVNTIAMALQFPDSEFIGLDLSERQIDTGNSMVRELGLRNVELRRANIVDQAKTLGEFDYIVSHGVYSWMPSDARDALIQTCSRSLARNGLAYVSYNTYPGWHTRGMVRDMMAYASRSEQPLERARLGRAFLDLITSVPPVEKAAGHAAMIQSERDLMQTWSDVYLAHDHFEAINEPVYFHEFAAHAARHRLAYLADVDLPRMIGASLPPATMQALQSVARDGIELEQYIDFVTNGYFRRTILCHEGSAIQRHIEPFRIRDFHVCTSLKPASQRPDISGSTEEVFQLDGGGLSTREPIQKAALVRLAEAWPRTLHLPDLVAAARRLLDGAAARSDPSRDASLVEECMLHASLQNRLVELSFLPRPAVQGVTDRPVAHPLARVCARMGQSAVSATRETVRLDEVGRALVMRLDGTRDRSSLVAELTELVRQGEVGFEAAPMDGASLRGRISSTLERQLLVLAERGILVA